MPRGSAATSRQIPRHRSARARRRAVPPPSLPFRPLPDSCPTRGRPPGPNKVNVEGFGRRWEWKAISAKPGSARSARAARARRDLPRPRPADAVGDLGRARVAVAARRRDACSRPASPGRDVPPDRRLPRRLLGRRARRDCFARITAGETSARWASLSGHPRTATIRALRDSELARLPRESFDRVILQHPAAMLRVAQLLVERLESTDRAARTPASGPAPTRCCRRASRSTPAASRPSWSRRSAGSAAPSSSGACAAPITRAPGSTASRAPTILSSTSPTPEPTTWTKLCMRQADSLLLLARAEAPARPWPVMPPARRSAAPQRARRARPAARRQRGARRRRALAAAAARDSHHHHVLRPRRTWRGSRAC